MTPTQRPTFTQRGGGAEGFVNLGGGSKGAIPSSGFDFTTGVLPSQITFTRASIGTYNSSGNLLITAGNNVARFNYVSGVANLLIEDTATNLLTQSNSFLAAVWYTIAGGVLTAAQFISPDGSNNGWSLTNGTGYGYVGHGFTFSNIQYTSSVWAKQITGTSPILLQIGSVNSGDTPITATITRKSFTGITSAITDQWMTQIRDPTPGKVIGIYGAQLETGSKMTSYIPTTTTSVTRSADSAVFTIPSGIGQLLYTFDDNSTQTVTVSPGPYTIPTTLSRANIKSIVGQPFGFSFTGGSLDSRISFTRASIGTYTNSGGTLITAGNDVARLNYVSGVANLLVEGSATNLFLQSNNFTTSWIPISSPVIAAAQFISPDGSNNGWSMSGNTAANAGGVAQNLPLSNITYTFSNWVKRITGVGNESADINGVIGNIVTSATLTRLSAVLAAPASPVYCEFFTVGDTGVVNGIYGAQLETGSKMTSYIPTTTAAVTRAADSAVFTVPSGVGHLTYTFDDNSTQSVTVSAGSYTIPTTLNRPNIKSIVGSA